MVTEPSPRRKLIFGVAAALVVIGGLALAGDMLLARRGAQKRCEARGFFWNPATSICHVVGEHVIAHVGRDCKEVTCPQGLSCRKFGSGSEARAQFRCVFACAEDDALCPPGYSCQNSDCVKAEPPTDP